MTLNPTLIAAIVCTTMTVIPKSRGALLLFSDNYDSVSSFSTPGNADQGGTMVSTTYTLPNNYVWDGPSRRGAGVLELAYASNASRVLLNLDYATVSSALDAAIEFDFQVGNYNPARGSQWAGVTLGGGTSAWPSNAAFSVIFFENGGLQVWNGGSMLVADTDAWESTSIKLKISGPDGTGSGFGPGGALATVWSGNEELGAWSVPSLTLSNYNFAFESYVTTFIPSGLTIDNFSVTAVPEPSVVVLGALGVFGFVRRRRLK